MNTLDDLIAYVKSVPSVWNAIPEVVRDKCETIHGLLGVYSYAVSKGLVALDDLKNLIDLDKCDYSVVRLYCHMFKIPVPNFPTESMVRTHVTSDFTISKVGNNFQYEVEHKLGTLDYLSQITTSNIVQHTDVRAIIGNFDPSAILKLQVLDPDTLLLLFSGSIVTILGDVATTKSIPDLTLTSMFMKDLSTGWAGTSNGKLLKTTDGWESWSLTTLTTVPIIDISFQPSYRVYALTSQGNVYASYDEGNTWPSFPYVVGGQSKTLKMFDARVGVMITNGLVVLTESYGAGWRILQGMSSATCVDYQDGMILVGTTDGKVCYTMDEGVTWHENFVFEGVPVKRVFIESSNSFYAHVSGYLMRTTSAGLEWFGDNIPGIGSIEKLEVEGSYHIGIDSDGKVFKVTRTVDSETNQNIDATLEANRLVFQNPGALRYPRFLFMYYKNYEKPVRLLAKHSYEIDETRYSEYGLKLYLMLLLQNNVTMSVESDRRLWPYIQLFTHDALKDNRLLSSLLQDNADVTTRTTFTPASMVFRNPRLISDRVDSFAISVTIESDLQTDINSLIRDAIVNYFLPFREKLSLNLTINLKDYSTDWLDKSDKDLKGISIWSVENDFVVS